MSGNFKRRTGLEYFGVESIESRERVRLSPDERPFFNDHPKVRGIGKKAKNSTVPGSDGLLTIISHGEFGDGVNVLLINDQSPV